MASRTSSGFHRRRFTAQQRQRLLARYHKGQLTQRGFAAREGIGMSTLVKWLREERAKAPPQVSFQEVALPGMKSPWVLEVVNPQGWTMRSAQRIDAESLAQLLRALPC
jgi:transposase-like protein